MLSPNTKIIPVTLKNPSGILNAVNSVMQVKTVISGIKIIFITYFHL